MITAEVHKPDKISCVKSVYYRSHGRIIRKALIDDDGSVIRDYLYEYNEDQLIECIVLYAQDHITIAGVKKYHYYENSSRIKRTEEFKFKNNSEIRTQKAEHVYNDADRTCIVTLYGGSDEPVGYEYYGYRNDDDFMSLLGCFNMNNEKVSCLEFKLEKLF
jgi:hypothetical protein